MVLKVFLDFAFSVLDALLSLLPSVQWNFDSSVLEPFLDILRVVAYLLPMDTVMDILSLFCALMGFRIVIALIKTIWSLIPIL